METQTGLREVHGEPVTDESVMELLQVCALAACGVCH